MAGVGAPGGRTLRTDPLVWGADPVRAGAIAPLPSPSGPVAAAGAGAAAPNTGAARRGLPNRDSSSLMRWMAPRGLTARPRAPSPVAR